MKNQINSSLIKKWQGALEAPLGRSLKTQQECHVVATLLENQYKLNKGYLPESQSVTSDMATYQNYAMPLVRRMFPELLAMNVTSVQPLTQPYGLAFALRFRYDECGVNSFSDTEMGYNYIKPEWTGTGIPSAPAGWSIPDGELLSNYIENCAGGITNPTNQIARGKLTIEQASIQAKTRKIKTSYTVEMQQDLANVHGQDVEQLMMETLQYELQQELDRELLMRMKSAAVNPALGGAPAYTIDVTPGNTAGVTGTTVVSDGRWGQERFATIANAIVAASQKLRITTRQGQGNFVIASPGVVAALQSLNNGIFTRNDVNVNGSQMGVKVGTLLGTQIDVYVDTFATSEYALVGFKGEKLGQSGIIYMPYIPLMVQKTMGAEDASPRIILSTRYAILDSLFGSGTFYRMLNFTGLNAYFPGLSY